MRIVGALALLALMISCSGSSETDEAEQRTFTEEYFPQFPGLHFRNVALGTTDFVAKTTLEKEGYREKSGHTLHFENTNDQTEVVFPDDDLLYSFKVFFFAEEHLAKAEEIKSLFDQYAVEAHTSDSFSVWSFDTIAIQFKITLFEQPELLRLHYELKSAP